MEIQRSSVVIAVIFSVMASAGCSRQQDKPAPVSLPAVTQVLASIGEDEKSHDDAATAERSATPSSQSRIVLFDVIFSESRRGAAYSAGKNNTAYVVHNKKRGKEYASIGDVVLSPEGQHIAYKAFVDNSWRMVTDGREGKAYSALAAPVFSPDGRHVAYQAKEDGRWYLVVDNKPNTGAKDRYSTHEFNADSNLIAYVEKQDDASAAKLYISDLKFRKQQVKESIGNALIVNSDRTRIAATQIVGGKVRLIDFSFARPDVVREGRLYDAIEKLTFGDDGISVSYCAETKGTRVVVLDTREEQLPAGHLPELPVIRPGKKGVGYLVASKDGHYLHESFSGGSKKGKLYDEAASLIYSENGEQYAYTARKGKNWFVVVNGNEGPAFHRVVTPVFSRDGKMIAYRAREEERRFLVVANTAGKTIKQFPAYEQVFQPAFSADGRSVVYCVKDGRELVCKVEGV